MDPGPAAADARRRPGPRRGSGSPHRWRTVMALVALAAVAATACSGGEATSSTPDEPATTTTTFDPTAALRLTTLSGPPQHVTGGDAVVAVDSPAGVSLDSVRVTLDGADVTDRFVPDSDPHRPVGARPRRVATLTDLPEGPSTVEATNGDDVAELVLTNHPVGGPLFSGPHQEPFVCTTEEAGLGPAGEGCTADTRVTWRYLTPGGDLAETTDPSTIPADVPTTTTSEGRTVPFVVRVETTVLNRSITTIAVLDPAPGTGWDPSGWNGRLVLQFGGGCGTLYSQGEATPSVLDGDLLGDGYAVANGSLTTFATHCNATVAAESALVAKEHFSERYGVPRHTIGRGGSGGAIQQLQIVQNYPGILDAIAPAAPFPDAVSIAAGVADCALLERWFGRDGGPAGIIPAGQPTGAGLREDQQLAITGFGAPTTCGFWTSTFVDTLDPSNGCARALFDEVYDLAVRPDGVRCTTQDTNVNLLGTDPETGFAERPLDNVGVQYGLGALRTGAISVDEFLDLNEHIGGFTIDGGWQPERTRASDEVLERTYRAGMVTAGTATQAAGALGQAGSGGLADVPVIIVNRYTDLVGDIHDRQRAFAIRERLRSPDGTPDPNLVIWSVPGYADLGELGESLNGTGDGGLPTVAVLDQWLTAAEDAAGATAGDATRGDGRGAGTWPEQLAAARPADATDQCLLGFGQQARGPDIYVLGTPCAELYRFHADPRQVAGAPLVNDVLGCSLVAVDPSGYGVAFTDAQVERLQRVFPDGVCDWSVPGRGQVEPAGVWQDHGGS